MNLVKVLQYQRHFICESRLQGPLADNGSNANIFKRERSAIWEFEYVFEIQF